MELSTAPKEKSQGKRRGPAPTGQGTPIQVRVHEQFLKALDDWRSVQRPIPSRPEAIRQLAEIGLRRK
jgi:hypothetical protein